MAEQFDRTRMLLGDEAIETLKNSRIAVFGVGGVGGYVVEALARAGVGALDIIDRDVVSESNINRQIIALHSTVGQPKVQILESRISDINPYCFVRSYHMFFLPETASNFNFHDYDYVVDAVDNMTAKLQLVESCEAAGTPIISSMGTGNKLDPTRFEVADIYSTSVDPLARVMRRELKKRGIDKLKVVYSREEPIKVLDISEDGEGIKTSRVPGSVSFVPSVAGLIIAGEVIKDLIGNIETNV